MPWPLTKGKVFQELSCAAGHNVLAVDRASACVFPSHEQLQPLLQVIHDLHLSVVSIGCGVGFLEGLLEKADVQVDAVDLEVPGLASEDYQQRRCFCTSIYRVGTRELFSIDEPSATCLLFCFGRRLPWMSYLDAYPTVPVAVLIGDVSPGNVTDPTADALTHDPAWSLMSAHLVDASLPGTTMMIYRRVTSSEEPSMDNLSATEHPAQASPADSDTELDIDAI